MINLKTFFKNHFDNAEISDDHLRKFAEDHLARLKANNDDGSYTQMIAQTTQAFNNFSAAISKEDTQYTQQQGSTIEVDTIIADFKESVSRAEGLINYTFGIKSPAYQEFFPMGVTEYSHSNKANIETLMLRMANKAQKYSVQLNSAFVNQFSDFPLHYAATRQKQLEDIGRVSADKTITYEVRNALETQLMSNLLVIAARYLGNSERGMDFFDQSIIRRNIYTTDEGEMVNGNIDATTTKTLLRDFDSNASFVLSNVGKTPLRFCISNTENDPCTSSGITVSEGDTITATILELNVNGGTMLNVTNLSPDKTGTYEVERLA